MLRLPLSNRSIELRWHALVVASEGLALHEDRHGEREEVGVLINR